MAAMDFVNLTINACALLVTVLLAAAGLMSGDLKQPVFRAFYRLILAALAALLNELLIALLAGHSSAAAGWAVRLADTCSYLLFALVMAAYIGYLYRYLAGKTGVARWPFALALCFGAATILLAVLAAFNRMYARFDSQNQLVVQSTFWISQIFPTLQLLLCLAITARYRQWLSRRELVSLLLYPAVNIACLVVETAVDELWLSPFGTAITLFFIYTNLQADLREQMRRQDEELAQARIAVMLSQIQPHFLYNTLTAIDRLCYDKPAAHQALLTFSEYLRVNMDSLTQQDPVPFEKELEHTRQYLWLEELRFEERLRVVYDIRASEFMIPALTLQPIVENAVRHGITKTQAGGTLSIRAQAEEDCYRVTVADDGAGFDPAAPPLPGRSHMGIDNVRARLAAICGGRLTIASAPGKGTAAVIEIPKRPPQAGGAP